MHALELARFQGMVLDRHGQSPRRGVERRALRHRPRAQHVADLEAQVEVQRGRIVKLNDKARHARHGNVRSVGDRRKRLALVAAIMGSFVAGLDSTAVNVALPAIRADLGGGLAGQQWVSNAYLLALGSLILVGGSLGDLFGERRVFSIGVGGFGVVSLLCAISPSIELPDRVPRTAGRVRGSADAERAGGDRGRVPVARSAAARSARGRRGRGSRP